jgi:hypothetical protein
MKGKWKGVNHSKKNPSVRVIDITSVNANNFAGTRSIEINGRFHMQIVTEISGHINKDTFYIKDGSILLKKEPPHTVWVNCSQCVPFNRVMIDGDSLLLTSIITDCDPSCNGVFSYYKMIPDFDTATQRVVITLFGTPEQIAAFNARRNVPPVAAASDPDEVAKKKQQFEDSLKVAAAVNKKREQQMLDSLKLAASIAKKRQQEINDSLQLVAKRKRQRQQQIDDSLEYVANIQKAKRQQEITDSLKNAATIAKQKQQQYDDSIRIAKQREQRLGDSLQNVAKLEKAKRQKEIADSIKNAEAIAKQRQQQYDDSVRIAKQRQQQIKDSLQNVAKLEKAKREQEIADSIKNAEAIAKQKKQQYDDSVRIAKLRQQHIRDSLQTAALAKKRQQIADSLKLVAAIAKQKRQQQIADSLKNVAIAKQKQQRYEDSLKMVQQRQKQIVDSMQNVANIAKIRQQEIRDSIKIAAGKKQPVSDTANSDVAKAQTDKSKALTQRDNVLLQTYHLKNPDILIELFDNAEIDGDRVSVFHNNSLIVNNQSLLKTPITFKVHADSTQRMHEFILVAENLGSIPPNTALMRVTADKQQYKLSVKTDLKTNAKIVFYYDGN